MPPLNTMQTLALLLFVLLFLFLEKVIDKGIQEWLAIKSWVIFKCFKFFWLVQHIEHFKPLGEISIQIFLEQYFLLREGQFVPKDLILSVNSF